MTVGNYVYKLNDIHKSYEIVKPTLEDLYLYVFEQGL